MSLTLLYITSSRLILLALPHLASFALPLENVTFESA